MASIVLYIAVAVHVLNTKHRIEYFKQPSPDSLKVALIYVDITVDVATFLHMTSIVLWQCIY